jgi:alginate O-acetyltransferase complex protein AlgI
MAGPIIRYIDIKDQLNNRVETVDKFVAGIKRFSIGLAKKVIIANNLGYVTDLIFCNLAIENTVGTAWLGIICYTFQIYFDFSGYSDMAIGLAKIFGFQFLENFNYPYISKTLTEFWRRWHISLSSWFRDYVYIPLGGNRKGNVYVHLFFVFVLTGFWHGASFHFLAWGLWHGFFLIIERLFGIREVKNKFFVPLRYAFTMLIVITGWVLFRSPDLSYGLTYLGIMFGIISPENVGFTIWYYINPKVIFYLVLALIASTPLLKQSFIIFKLNKCVNGIWKSLEYVFILALLLISLVFVTASSYNPFIYFRF